jgi:signal transduction histidine kinase
MIHLFSNAFDAMPGGGSLTVATASDTMQGTPYAVIKISDTGEGISEERLGMVFEPFFSTRHGASKGTGLGLAIVKKIIEEHRGFIRTESPGQGSYSRVYLPLNRPEGSPVPRIPEDDDQRQWYRWGPQSESLIAAAAHSGSNAP